jgi:hypothetical protein
MVPTLVAEPDRNACFRNSDVHIIVVWWDFELTTFNELEVLNWSARICAQKTGGVEVATSRIGALFNTDARSNGSSRSIAALRSSRSTRTHNLANMPHAPPSRLR